MRKGIAVMFLSVCCMVGCSRQVTMKDGAKMTASECARITADGGIPYIVADQYFVRNDLDSLPPTKIASEADFKACFGMATVMGVNGKPTEIDFKHQYVISVALPETNIYTEIVPVGLKKADDGKIKFSYQIKQGEEMTSTMMPLLLIVVDRKYDGKVVLDAIGNI